MKSYTDISQSKTLSKILPLESADMCYEVGEDLDGYITKTIYTPLMHTPHNDDYIPCWSLAVLLSVIPFNVSFNKAVYRFKLVKFSDCWECYHENFGTVSTEIFKADNPVDACYEIIIHLHELNLL